MPDSSNVHAYQLDSTPGYSLCIGVPAGRVRPALWLVNQERGESMILAQFHGAAHARLAIDFLDRMTDSINAVIHHLEHKHDEPSDEGKGSE